MACLIAFSSGELWELFSTCVYESSLHIIPNILKTATSHIEIYFLLQKNFEMIFLILFQKWGNKSLL